MALFVASIAYTRRGNAPARSSFHRKYPLEGRVAVGLAEGDDSSRRISKRPESSLLYRGRRVTVTPVPGPSISINPTASQNGNASQLFG